MVLSAHTQTKCYTLRCLHQKSRSDFLSKRFKTCLDIFCPFLVVRLTWQLVSSTIAFMRCISTPGRRRCAFNGHTTIVPPKKEINVPSLRKQHKKRNGAKNERIQNPDIEEKADRTLLWQLIAIATWTAARLFSPSIVQMMSVGVLKMCFPCLVAVLCSLQAASSEPCCCLSCRLAQLRRIILSIYPAHF